MSNVDCLLGFVSIAACKCAVSQHAGQELECSNFEVNLDFVDRLATRRHSNAETVVEEGGVSILVGGIADVGIVIVVVREVPVASIKPNTVSQDLKG